MPFFYDDYTGIFFFLSETASTSKVFEISNSPDEPTTEDKLSKIPLRRASSDLVSRSSAENLPNFLENRLSADLPKLNAKLQNLANDTKQFIRRRTTHLVPKNQTPYLEDKNSARGGSPPVEVGQEAADVDLGQSRSPTPSNELKTAWNPNDQPPNSPGSIDSAIIKPKSSKTWIFVSTYWRQIFFVVLLFINVLDIFPSFFCGLLWGVYFSANVFRFIFYLYIPLDEEVDHRWAEQTSPVVATEEDLTKVDKLVYKVNRERLFLVRKLQVKATVCYWGMRQFTIVAQ